jgi:Thiamine biosynthesis protein ThiC
MRTEWIAKRSGHKNVSQMHYGRQGIITEEMDFVAKRENLPAELILEEVARGRMIILLILTTSTSNRCVLALLLGVK